MVAGGDLPEPLAWDLFGGVGFTGAVGQTHRVLHEGRPVQVLIGVGDRDTIDVAALRDAAAAFSNATDTHAHITVRLSPVPNLAAGDAAQAIVEGVLLARYRYDALKSEPSVTALTDFSITIDADAREAVTAGVERGRITAGATILARDLANTPPALLTAEDMADVAVALGEERGFGVEVFDREALTEMGCGGILGVNAGSVREPRLV